jgi:hypothetical protein
MGCLLVIAGFILCNSKDSNAQFIGVLLILGALIYSPPKVTFRD